jgi:hypothetical protein
MGAKRIALQCTFNYTSVLDVENDKQIVWRLPENLVAALNAYAEKLSREFGVPVSQAAAGRRLLADGLGRAGFHVSESEDPSPAAKPKSRKRTR